MSGWNNIIGHGWAVELLAKSVRNDRISHAYLITGIEQIGKTTLARSFAQAINCTAASDERPCGKCRSCNLIASDHHPDIRVVRPEVSPRGKLSIKIEQVREMLYALNLSSYEARYKVAIMERFDTANINAANAFLKTLEEPPPNVVLVLTANDADSLLPTISSRCRTIALRPLGRLQIEAGLMTRWGVNAESAGLLSHLADGRLGWAVSAVLDHDILAERDRQIASLLEALDNHRAGRFRVAEKLARKPELLPALLKTWLSWWRDTTILAYQSGEHAYVGTISNIDQAENLRKYSASWGKAPALTAFKQTELALWQLERNANTRLVLENLLLKYPLSTE